MNCLLVRQSFSGEAIHLKASLTSDGGPAEQEGLWPFGAKTLQARWVTSLKELERSISVQKHWCFSLRKPDCIFLFCFVLMEH